MGLPNLIMVGIDYSYACMSALKEAERLALHYGATLSVVNVLDQRLLDEHQWDCPMIKEDLIEANRDLLALTVRNELSKKIVSRPEFRVGHPFFELIGCANDREADLLVLGSRGMSSGRQGQVGSVAKKCIRKASMPTLLVRRSHHGPFRKIVACVDFSETSRLATEHAVRIAHAEKASLEIVHVCRARAINTTGFGSLEPITPVLNHYQIVKAVGNELERFMDSLRESTSGLDVSTRILEGKRVGTMIAYHLESTGADLAVIGTRGRSAFKALLMGTNAECLIEESPCSVLAIKPEGFGSDINGI